MKTETTLKPIAEVKPEDVLKVYSGRPGCGCGCRGTYRVNPLHLDRANKERGYDYEANEVNFTQVKKILNILKAREGEVEVTETKTLIIYAIEAEKNFWVYVIK